MLRLKQLSLRRSSRLLLESAELTIHAGWRVGLVGANGAGKSSLFALIQGQISADSGQLELPAGWTLAQVAQETPPVDKSALDYVLDGDAELRKLQGKLDSVDELQLAELHNQLDNIDAYTAETRATKLLYGLGFVPGDEKRAVREFSGGWRMRLNLAQALMCRSDLLLLDEPTNHLDFDAILWLEQWLGNYPGTLLLISHDREFLDHTATHIAHLNEHKLTLYTGNYSLFEQARAQALIQQQAAHTRQKREIDHLNNFIERFRAKATKARQAQSRLKTLERMTLVAPVHAASKFDFTISASEKLPSPLISLDQVTIGYTGLPLLQKINLSLHPGDRLGILGPNGAGKSTLIKLLANEIEPIQGKFHMSSHLVTGYFAQHQLEQLDLNASPLTHLQRIDPLAKEQALRTHLGKFSFSGEQALALSCHFSGGEKARLVLALLCYSRPNLLLLDEPTNHLDLEMRQALSAALIEYEGAVVLVSHDRHLINTVCERLVIVADGQAIPFDGDQEDYGRWLTQRRLKCHSSNNVTNISPPLPKAKMSKEKRGLAETRRQNIKSMNERVKRLEKEHDKILTQQNQLLSELANPSLYEPGQSLQLTKLLDQQSALKLSLAATEDAWLEANEHLENMRSEESGN